MYVNQQAIAPVAVGELYLCIVLLGQSVHAMVTGLSCSILLTVCKDYNVTTCLDVDIEHCIATARVHLCHVSAPAALLKQANCNP